MCTLSFWPLNDGAYFLLHSRDELRTRAAAAPPQPVPMARVATLAPRDGEAGGTWFAVDGEGHLLCVLNGTEDEPPSEVAPRSRGLLAFDLAADLRRSACERALTVALRRDRYRPFVLVHAEPGGPQASLHLWRWNGITLTAETHIQPHVEISNRFDQATAERIRRALQQEHLRQHAPPSTAALRRVLWSFHHLHRDVAPAGDVFSPCMHHDRACTRSLALFDSRREHRALFYRAGSPCEHAPIQSYRVRASALASNSSWTSRNGPR